MGNPGSDGTPNATHGTELVTMLVERGADPNQQMFFRAPKESGLVSASARGTTPFHRACASHDIAAHQVPAGAWCRCHAEHRRTAKHR